MATAQVTSFLSDNNDTTPFDELALKVWAGILLGAYNLATVTEGRHMQRTISSGKSAQFPVFGPGNTVFHTRGEEITFQEMGATERVVSIQDLLLAPYFIDVLDEAKAHFDIRREIAVQQGQQLAEQADLRVLMSKIVASRTAANITYPVGQETPAGDRITGATIGTEAAVLKAGIYDAAEDLDEHNVPSSDRYCFLAPAQFYLLLQDGEFIDRDFSDGSNGSRATAVMRNAADFEVVKTNNLPRADVSSGGAADPFPTNLQLDYTANIAVCSHMSAAASVTLIGLGFESEYDANRQGHMMIAKYAKGFDYLRPEAAVELATS